MLKSTTPYKTPVETKSRDQNRFEVVSFLQKNVSTLAWDIHFPPFGTGQESYAAQNSKHTCFIKLGAEIERYQIMSELGFSPPVIATGFLENGTTILVQKYIVGRMPSRRDFQTYLEKFASIIRDTHESDRLKQILPPKATASHREVGLEVIKQVEKRWGKIRSQVPSSSNYVDEKIAYLKEEVSKLSSRGLVASHNDICNGNWLISNDEKIYLLDYEGMSLDDPALDIGAILWWYYPKEMRERFLEITGYNDDENFHNRMRIRMAIHNLHIIIPRDNSFDRFSVDNFDEALTDFRTVIDGKENPQGYND